MKNFKNYASGVLIVLIMGSIITACSKKSQVSPKTGWKYNDKSSGFSVKRVKEGPGPGLVAIEGGTMVLGGSLQQDLAYEYDNIMRRVSVASFYMDETTVANVDWLEYLHWITRNFPSDREYYYKALPDTLVWRRPLSYNEPYVYNYLRHPAYQEYPVVGVSWEQANAYCEWRTDRVNEKILKDKGILAGYKTQSGKKPAAAIPQNIEPFNTEIYLNGQYRGAGIDGKNMPVDINALTNVNSAGKLKDKKSIVRRPIRLEDGLLKSAYRLPTEAEWEYAALALAGNTEYENLTNGKVYPWNGLGLRSDKRRTQGLFMANFKRGFGDNAGVGGYLNDKADITAPVRSYMPNDFGLYNMVGNVNQWTADTYRKFSFQDFEDFNPFRGNLYKDKLLADSQKGTYAKDKYGRPIYVPAKSSRKLPWSQLKAHTPDSTNLLAKNIVGKPYNADFRGAQDSIHPALYGRTTLVNNRSKVYKGGSWNDRAFWLNPATRRYMDQDSCSAELGFRCAMTRVGPPEINASGKPHFKPKKPKK